MPESVMVIEDNGAVRRSLVDVLELQGVTVIETNNGIQALRTLEEGVVPGVIVLDLELPFLSGWYLHRQLQRHEVFSRIPVVIVTAHDVSAVGIPGAQGILHKPLTSRRLFDALRACSGAVPPPVAPPAADRR